MRDPPIFEVPVELVVPRLRACGACGPKLERLNWLEAYARVTSRLAASVAPLSRRAPRSVRRGPLTQPPRRTAQSEVRTHPYRVFLGSTPMARYRSR